VKPPNGSGVATQHFGREKNKYGIYNKGLISPEGKATYLDKDGLETIPAWNCPPHCPVKFLDEQSGTLTSGSGAKSNRLSTGWAGGPFSGDSGSASRFFPQFPSETALQTWLSTLTGAV
jgi:hypothetical protein